MEKSKQKKLKGLCRVIEVLAKIAKVFSIIAIPCLVLVMVMVPYLVNNVSVKNNSIVFTGFDQKITLIEEGKNNTNLKIKVGDEIIATENEGEMIATFKKLLNDTSKTKIIASTEVSLTFALADIILCIIILSYITKLFKNIRNENTPFTLDNVNYIRKIAHVMIALLVLPIIASIIIQIITGSEVDINVKINIIEILFVFVLSYIFEYGYELQKDSKKTIYEITDK